MAKTKSLPLEELTALSGVPLKKEKECCIIKYNPVNSGSIVAACLMALVMAEVFKTSTEFEATAEVIEAKPLNLFKKYNADVKADAGALVFPRNSVFRSKGVPILIWAASSESEQTAAWQKGKSSAVAAKLIMRYNNLKDAKVFSKIVEALNRNEVTEDWILSASGWDNCITFQTLQSSKALAGELVAAINGANKAPETNEAIVE